MSRTETSDAESTDRSDPRTPDGDAVLARLARPRADTPTRIALLSDPHVSTGKEGTWKLYHRTRDRFRAALADCAARDVDAVAVAGDLTEDGRPEDFAWIRGELDALAVPLLAVPGNHDVPKSFDQHDTPSLDAFEAAYAPDGFPAVVEVGGVTLVGLNSAAAPDGSLASTHDGAVSPDQLEGLDAVLENAENPIVVAHHNLPGLGAGGEAWLPHDPVRDADSLLAVLERHDVPLHVSGHIHVPMVARTAGVTGLVCPALCSFPQAYLLLDVDSDGTTVTYVPVATSEEADEAYECGRTHSSRSEAVCELVTRQLGDLPLLDERTAAEAFVR